MGGAYRVNIIPTRTTHPPSSLKKRFPYPLPLSCHPSSQEECDFCSMNILVELCRWSWRPLIDLADILRNMEGPRQRLRATGEARGKGKSEAKGKPRPKAKARGQRQGGRWEGKEETSSTSQRIAKTPEMRVSNRFWGMQNDKQINSGKMSWPIFDPNW